MKLPLVQSVELSTWAWFTLIYLAIVLAVAYLLYVNLRRPLDIMPATWLGKGQLFFLVFLWTMVVGNLCRAITSFSEQRILTEGTIFVVGIILTLMIVLCPKNTDRLRLHVVTDWKPHVKRAVVIGLIGTLLAVFAEFTSTRLLYGDAFPGHAGPQERFGPDAVWRSTPLRKGQDHL